MTRSQKKRPATKPTDDLWDKVAKEPIGKLKPTKLQSTPFVPRNDAQIEAKAELDAHAIVFLIGPAGTAKTTLAAAQAVDDMKAGRARRIILARAPIDAGEEGGVGFLPGGLREKMETWCRPMLDALTIFYGKALVKTMLDQELIEMLPPAMMRGQSIHDATVIMDEFQNLTPHQAKMMLTRVGENCRMVLTCDPDQCDLPPNKLSAALDLDRFVGTKGIVLFDFEEADVTRSEVCRAVLECYRKP